MRFLLLVLATLIAPTAAAAEQTCRSELGAQRAAVLVRQCTGVSPATHPPCQADNPCALITSEIERGCGLLGADAPKFCRTVTQAK